MIASLLLVLAPLQTDVDRWAEARAALDPERRAGLDFLLEHMPARDRDSIDVDLVVENVELAYDAWEAAPWSGAIDEAIFLNDVLPYASIDERRDRWRRDFHERFAPLVAEARTPSEAAAILNQEVFPAVGVRYSTQRPKANQSPYESIDAGMASCTGLSVLLVDACRAVGVPARLVGTPLWADGSGNHTWVEIWDGRWRFTGAAEPTGDALDRGWFTGRASKAIRDDPQRAIYATSYRRTPIAFPMVWSRGDQSVPGVNVTDRYVAAEPIPAGHARLRVRVRSAAGERVVSDVSVFGIGGGDPIAEGETRDESFDANDHLTFVLPAGRTYRVRAWNGFAVVNLTEDETLLDVHMGETTSRVVKPSERLLEEHVARVRRERAEEMDAKVLRIGELAMPFDFTVFGDEPEDGHSLWISMHGGGGAPARVNDQQWDNQKRLYRLEEGIYVAPRAPTDTWNLWHQAHIDAFFDRLIENFVAFHGVDPTRVYLLGYSAGGDGVYQLAPRMADRFAAAAMMAGHPNETQPDGLRNLPFTLHMGAQDSAYGRNGVAAQWRDLLAELHEADPGGYVHWVEIHEGKGHWMDRQDAAALPWMAEHRLDRRPERIVWLQDDVVGERFYWLAVDDPQPRARVVVERVGQTFRIEEAQGVSELRILLDAELVSFLHEVVVIQGETELFRGRVTPSVDVVRRTLAERGHAAGVWTAEIAVSLP